MRRSFGIILWILLGALASAIGIGIVLRASNIDREQLTKELETAKAQVTALQARQASLTQESNQRVTDAAQQVADLQRQIQALSSLQSRMKTATRLTPPTPTQLRRWTEFASVAMGVSLRVPPGMQTQSSDDGLFVSTRRVIRGVPIEEQWLAFAPYRPEREQDIRSRLVNTKDVTYALGTRLLTGVRGTLTDGTQTLYLLSVQENSSTTHLLWGKTLEGVTERMVLDTIATLSFR
jgi:hypothetical protein